MVVVGDKGGMEENGKSASPPPPSYQSVMQRRAGQGGVPRGSSTAKATSNVSSVQRTVSPQPKQQQPQPQSRQEQSPQMAQQRQPQQQQQQPQQQQQQQPQQQPQQQQQQQQPKPSTVQEPEPKRIHPACEYCALTFEPAFNFDAGQVSSRRSAKKNAPPLFPAFASLRQKVIVPKIEPGLAQAEVGNASDFVIEVSSDDDMSTDLINPETPPPQRKRYRGEDGGGSSEEAGEDYVPTRPQGATERLPEPPRKKRIIDPNELVCSLPPPPPYKKKSLFQCKDFLNGKCKRPNCKFLHLEEERDRERKEKGKEKGGVSAVGNAGNAKNTKNAGNAGNAANAVNGEESDDYVPKKLSAAPSTPPPAVTPPPARSKTAPLEGAISGTTSRKMHPAYVAPLKIFQLVIKARFEHPQKVVDFFKGALPVIRPLNIANDDQHTWWVDFRSIMDMKGAWEYCKQLNVPVERSWRCTEWKNVDFRLNTVIRNAQKPTLNDIVKYTHALTGIGTNTLCFDSAADVVWAITNYNKTVIAGHQLTFSISDAAQGPKVIQHAE